jgi:3-phenylpropionate/cinnamic acid dioxygenase small subunit
MAHFDEDKYSLSQRVARMGTEHAWAEDPPSRLRHFVTNVRTFECDDPDDNAHLVVQSAELLFRSRGDVNESALVSCGREDLLRWSEGPPKTLKLARRRIIADESVLRMQNLAVFL